jgi:hypothetical protein
MPNLKNVCGPSPGLAGRNRTRGGGEGVVSKLVSGHLLTWLLGQGQGQNDLCRAAGQ